MEEAKLLFCDDFDEPVLDLSKWTPNPPTMAGATNRWMPDCIVLSGEGCLDMLSRWNEEKNILESAGLRTVGKFEHGFGYYEARMKFPVIEGVWGAFWLIVGNMESDMADGTAVDGCEIDIIESFFSYDRSCNQAVHWDGYHHETKSNNHLSDAVNIYDDAFHTFGVWRKEDSYRFYIDRKLTWVTDKGGICPEDGYIMLTCEGKAWYGVGSEKCRAALPSHVYVDYVKVWDTLPFDGEE